MTDRKTYINRLTNIDQEKRDEQSSVGILRYYSPLLIEVFIQYSEMHRYIYITLI